MLSSGVNYFFKTNDKWEKSKIEIKNLFYLLLCSSGETKNTISSVLKIKNKLETDSSKMKDISLIGNITDQMMK